MTTHMPMTPIGDPVSVPSTPTNPTDDPVGTVRVQRDTGVWAVKTSQGDDTGKGQHVWLSPAGVIARDTYVLHHNEVRGWEVGEVRRWRTEEAAQAPVLEGLRRERDAAQLWNKAHETNNAALGKTNRELAAERDALRAERAAALDAAEARGRAEALSKAADAWQRGAWANTPRHRDQVADRVGQAQYVTEWLRERAATTAQSEGDHHA